MKKIISILFALAVVAMLVGCGGGSDSGPTKVEVWEEGTFPLVISNDGTDEEIELNVYESTSSDYRVIIDEPVVKGADPEPVYVQNITTGAIYFAEVGATSEAGVYKIITDVDDFALACPGIPDNFLGKTYSSTLAYGTDDPITITTKVANATERIVVDGVSYKAYPITYTFDYTPGEEGGTFSQTRYWVPSAGWYLAYEDLDDSDAEIL